MFTSSNTIGGGEGGREGGGKEGRRVGLWEGGERRSRGKTGWRVKGHGMGAK